MYSILFLALVSFGLSLVFTPLVRAICIRFRILDQPDRRKQHSRPVPRVGGIAIALAYLSAYGLLLLAPLKGGHALSASLPIVWKLAPAAAMVFLIGLLDDLIGLRPWEKLAGQSLGALWAFAIGVQVRGVAGISLDTWWSLPLTVLWLVGCTNAFNLIDGVDGLAAGVGLVATVTTCIAALLNHQVPLALATVTLAGCLLGFLRYNFNPATIFLGDCGSLLIGFLLGCYGLIWSHKAATLLSMTAPLIALSIPLLDVGLSIVRRYLRHQPIFTADRGHIHHRLLDKGLTPRRAVLLIYGFCGLAAALSLMQSVLHNRFRGLVIVLFCAVTWIGIQKLGYVEFGLARRLLARSEFRRMLNAQIRMGAFEQSLAGARTAEDCWRLIRDASRDFGFYGVRVQFAGRLFEEQMSPEASRAHWQMRVLVSDSDYVNLTGGQSTVVPQTVLMTFADTLHGTLAMKLSEMGAWAARHANGKQRVIEPISTNRRWTPMDADGGATG